MTSRRAAFSGNTSLIATFSSINIVRQCCLSHDLLNHFRLFYIGPKMGDDDGEELGDDGAPD